MVGRQQPLQVALRRQQHHSLRHRHAGHAEGGRTAHPCPTIGLLQIVALNRELQRKGVEVAFDGARAPLVAFCRQGL
ncbi:hypothetical protein D3C73_1045330 [compost metagenome]